MKRLLLLTVVLVIAVSCKPRKEVMYRAVVGTKTDLFEVVSSKELKLAPGVKSQIVGGPCGPRSGIALLRQNGTVGGYMVCGCVGESQGCFTVNDNPEHPSCGGNCIDGQGNAHGCEMWGPIIGPPRDPARIELRER